VADGVGSWNEMGIDPALFSQELCRLIGKNYQNYLFEKEMQNEGSENSNKNFINELNLKAILTQSVEENDFLGSSTVCCLYLDPLSNTLYSVNIGDSAYMILRKDNVKNLYKILYKSEEQTHGFNIPYQVGKEGDNPRNAQVNKIQLQVDDLVILATDGLWDNLSDEEITNVCNSFLDQKELEPMRLSKYIAEKVSLLSLKKDYESPFSKRAKENGYLFLGGKPDDITILIAKISQISELERQFKYDDPNSFSTADRSSFFSTDTSTFN
jgi:protein phosphatase PTC7